MVIGLVSLARLVTMDGYLNDSLIFRREPLYQGMNGRFVERLYLSPSESYIFKPVTHFGQEKREVWVYQHILPHLPKVYPDMLAFSIEEATSWIMYEDLGHLTHQHDVDAMLHMMKLIASWHSVPVHIWAEANLVAPKPKLQEMADSLLMNKRVYVELLENLHVPVELLEYSVRELSDILVRWWDVMSHGDLHAGNYAFGNGNCYVLDWEHAHLNIPMWDLYHVIDMSHPVFPRTSELTNEQRHFLLMEYMRSRGVSLAPTPSDTSSFIEDYYHVAWIFSLWMSGLIQSDLERGSTLWSRDQLQRQWQECCSTLVSVGGWLTGSRH